MSTIVSFLIFTNLDIGEIHRLEKDKRDKRDAKKMQAKFKIRKKEKSLKGTKTYKYHLLPLFGDPSSCIGLLEQHCT